MGQKNCKFIYSGIALVVFLIIIRYPGEKSKHKLTESCRSLDKTADFYYNIS